jgi:hypothetical protein
MAERVRFELTVPSSGTPAFEAGAFNRSTTSPYGTNWRPPYYPRLGVDTFFGRWGPLSPEETAELLGGFVLEYTGRDFKAVVCFP